VRIRRLAQSLQGHRLFEHFFRRHPLLLDRAPAALEMLGTDYMSI
jgi:hypothetical protein